MKHTFGLRTVTHKKPDSLGKRPALFYIHAEPDRWPDGRPIPALDLETHRAEIAHFAELTRGDEVEFRSCPYRALLDAWETHCGYSHGGNGYEGMAFIIEQFKNIELEDPTDPNHGLDLKALAVRFATAYREEKAQSKEAGSAEPRALPGVHHPIFRGKPVNFDPRERFISDFMSGRGDYNIFLAYYRELVQALYDTGVSRYVFCVNVDAVIAALLLAILWKDYRAGALNEKDLETAAFNVFLYGRMIGAAAEIDDHLNRGRNMDTRTPQEQCAFVI